MIRIEAWFIRHLVHAGMVIFAGILLISPPWLAFALPLTALAGNLCMRPWVPWIFPRERTGHGHLEVVHYPMAVLASYLALGKTQIWPLVAWLTLALGDPLLSMAQRFAPAALAKPTFPWNGRKPLWPHLIGQGLALPLVLVLAQGTLKGFGVDIEPHGARCVLALAVAAGLMAESLWFGIDDNFIMPFAVCTVAGLYLAWQGGAYPGTLEANRALAYWPFLFAGLALASGKITRGGGLMGLLCAWLLNLAHPVLFGLLTGFFVLGVAATRLGLRTKLAHGLAEGQLRNHAQGPDPAKPGQAARARAVEVRGAAEVFGAAGLAAWTAPLVLATRHMGATQAEVLAACLVPAAALIAKTMDTVSSEVGKAFRGHTRVPPFFTPAPPGAEGGWSLAGTVAGLAAASFAAGIAYLGGLATPAQAVALVAIALFANLVESLWARYWQAQGQEPGAHTNVALTLAAATLAAWLWV